VFASDQSGYFRETQRPQTIGYPLADSAAVSAVDLREVSSLDRQSRDPKALAVDASSTTSVSTVPPTPQHRRPALLGEQPPGMAGLSAGRIELQWPRRSFRTRYLPTKPG